MMRKEDNQTISPWPQRRDHHWPAGWSVRSLGWAQSPSVRTSDDKSPSAAVPDPCGPPGGHCGPLVPRFLAGSTPGDPIEEHKRLEQKSWMKREIMRDNDESWNWLNWLLERKTMSVYSYWFHKSTKADWFNKAALVSGCEFIDFWQCAKDNNQKFLCCARYSGPAV